VNVLGRVILENGGSLCSQKRKKEDQNKNQENISKLKKIIKIEISK